MKKSNIIKVSFVFMIFTIIYFIFRLFYIGYKVDLIAWTNEITIYKNIVLIFLAASIILTIFGVFFYTLKDKNRIPLFILLLCLIFIVTSFVLEPDWNLITEKQKKQAQEEIENSLREINWNTVLEKQRSDEYSILYIGRDNCPDC